MPPATTPSPRTINIVLSAACAFLTPAGLPGARGAAAFVAANALETIRLEARMAAPIIRIENSFNGLTALGFSTNRQYTCQQNWQNLNPHRQQIGNQPSCIIDHFRQGYHQPRFP